MKETNLSREFKITNIEEKEGVSNIDIHFDKSLCVAETDSSISILDIPQAISGTVEKNSAIIKSSTTCSRANFPSSIDPLFLDYYFVIPVLLKSFILRIDEMRFVYKFTDEKLFEIRSCKTGEVVYHSSVVSFEEDFDCAPDTDVVFVVNKDRCKKTHKNKTTKKVQNSNRAGVKV